MNNKNNKNIKNLPASIIAKLKNISKQSDQSFNLVCLRYYQERFLCRLSVSKYNNNFILKGGLTLLLLDTNQSRPTKDIDFLGLRITSNQDEIKQVFSEICEIKINDGISFDLESIITQKIIEGASYEGIRVKIDIHLGKMITKMTFDIGFENILLKKSKKIKFPQILEINDFAKINTYPFEAVIAEKLEAIVKLNYHTSRMKDFFDIYFIAQQFEFGETYLVDTIKYTFKNRMTKIENFDIIFSNEYKRDLSLHKQWKIFLTRNEITLNLKFNEVIENIQLFLYDILISQKEQIERKWNPTEWKWKKNI